MELITVFLVVLVAALGIGNAFLFLFEDKSPKRSLSKEAIPQRERVIERTANIAPIEKKIELAHKRIQILESSIDDSKNHGVSPSMKRRIEKLDNFRSTIEAEMIAIKEILEELQNNNITAKARVYKNKKNTKKISDSDLKKLIYNSK